MALAKVKTAEEMARLDAIWAELEAHKDELEEPKPDTRPQAEIDEENRKAKIRRLFEFVLMGFEFRPDGVKPRYFLRGLYFHQCHR